MPQETDKPRYRQTCFGPVIDPPIMASAFSSHNGVRTLPVGFFSPEDFADEEAWRDYCNA